MTQLLEFGADAESRSSSGITAIEMLFGDGNFEEGVLCSRARLLLSWGVTFIHDGDERKFCIFKAREWGYHNFADLFKSELGGRRCEIVNHSSRPELDGKTCVADEYLPSSNQYKVTLETKSQEVVQERPHNPARNEECKAFVAALNNNEETQPAVTEESEAAAEQAVQLSCWQSWASIVRQAKLQVEG
ncbi:hypothetical protein THAOC_25267, partial [Thalassiosira oceanica]